MCIITKQLFSSHLYFVFIYIFMKGTCDKVYKMHDKANKHDWIGYELSLFTSK